MYSSFAIFVGAFVTCALLLTAHIALWSYHERLKRVHAYIVGTTAIGVGVTVASLLIGDTMILIVFWFVAGPGGALIAAAWWIRGIVTARNEARALTDRIIEQAGERLNAISEERDDRRN